MCIMSVHIFVCSCLNVCVERIVCDWLVMKTDVPSFTGLIYVRLVCVYLQMVALVVCMYAAGENPCEVTR